MQDRGRAPSGRYAAVFCEEGGARAVGAVVLGDDRVLLEGRRGAEPVELSLWCAELTGVRIGRGSGERLNGPPTVVVERRSGPVLLIEPFGAALLHELADLLAALTGEPVEASEQVSVLVPLKRGCRQRAKELIAAGPPFDPAGLGLARHRVFLGAGEAIFVLEGPRLRQTLERAIRQPGFWRAGLAWHDCIAGRARIVDAAGSWTAGYELVYSWAADEGCSSSASSPASSAAGAGRRGGW